MSVETFHEGRVALHGGDCLDVVPQHKLRASPCNRHLEIGKAAEHLVCADLILSEIGRASCRERVYVLV